MRKDVQRLPKSQDQSKRKHTQHDMIEHAKSSSMFLTEKTKMKNIGLLINSVCEQCATKY
jgi:hypothetical protein